MSFDALKKNRGSSITKLVDAAEKLNSKKSYTDDRIWSPVRDKSGNGFAILRFLPAGAGDDLPWVQYWDHGFKGPSGKWYIENSLTSIGLDDPVSEANSVLWNSGLESDKTIARERKRRLHYVSNVLVVSDPANRDNEGKVFLFKYGKKIFDKLMDVMQPKFPGEVPINPYDFWEGADFQLKIFTEGKFPNYDKSTFAAPAELFGSNEAKLKEVYDSLYPLRDFVDPKNYKPYAELKKKFLAVIGEVERAGRMSTAEQVELNTTRDADPVGKTAAEPDFPESDAGGDDLSYFEKLAAEG